MWKRGILAIVTTLSIMATGCSDSSSGDQQSPEESAAAHPATDELFVGECGSMTDGDLVSITGVRGLASTSRNSIRCRWDAVDTGAYAMFTWYRGSPIDRERTVASQIGREIGIIDADGHPGFTARGSDASCEAGVESGDGFLHWSLNYAFAVPSHDVCDVVADLARATVENAK
ncbi:DUF3558 domain-containing protein [Rhodococcus sp. G-MC3]|uniref:DUF3558 domain-containing protein n=1 Tax=Rhodococcus sp. G-MC3 TaxID=3046209 RepID=UPI0024B9C3A2|nr:DUF3558 domain-containing protein [Rhodococcus sp. G-MC3]MDJ0395754.1 DUF3558 domain-containing protein [Rhodococcus sp. G-MC3]